jgi:ankyrin repeat protein
VKTRACFVLAIVSVVAVRGVHLRADQVPPKQAAAVQPDRRVVEAVKAGDQAAVTALLRQRVGVNTPEADGTTALHWAVRADDLELAELLIRAGADVKAINRYGVTAISLACVNGNAAMIERLLKAGIDVNAAGPEGETALMTAARTGRIEAVKLLLDRGATIDARESWHGQTALMWAAAQRHPAVVRELIGRGADVNARSNMEKWERQTTAEPREKWLPLGSMTPLLFASREGCVECARILVEAGADPNAADPDGVTPAISAIINGHYDVAALLVEKGADVNLADNTGRTPLYAAVDFNSIPASNRPAPNVVPNRATSLDVIKLLLDRGANPNPRLKKQQPYRTKVDRGNDTMLGAGTTPFIRAAKAADVAAMRLLIAAGADPTLATGNDTAVDVSAATPARRGGGGINGLMAAAGLGTKEEDTTGRFKTEAEIIDAITICLDAGTDINAVESNGRTALHGAAQKGYDQVVRFLAERGAKLEIKDRRGLTPLDAAMGLLGNGGFDGSRTDVHQSTAALLRQLTGMAATTSTQP